MKGVTGAPVRNGIFLRSVRYLTDGPMAGGLPIHKQTVPSLKAEFPGVWGHIVSLSRKAWPVIRRLNNEINVVLWAVGLAGAVYLLLHIPEMRDARVRADAQLAQQISDENKFYCEKWGMPSGTHEHVICTMDLVHIRQETEQRIADEMNF